MGYINGVTRNQGVLFPATLEEQVDEDNEVRVIDAFVGSLEFEELGFVRGQAADTGRPGYDPRILLAIYIWGHLNRIRSSRRLEKECARNVELMWLSGLLKPDFKTLCRFRQENAKAIAEVLVEFRRWCQKEGLFGNEIVAIDGSKFKAVNSRERSVTPEKLAKWIEREKQLVAEYMAELEETDEDDSRNEPKKLSAEELREKIEKLGKSVKENEKTLEEMEESGEHRRSLTDRDARMMKTPKGMEVSYNIQTAVDAKYKMIATVEVTNELNDHRMLDVMALKAKEDLGVEEITSLNDGGYYTPEAIKRCEENGVEVYVPIRSNKKTEKYFPREKFEYDREQDVYKCPAGEELRLVTHGAKTGSLAKNVRIYATKACAGCAFRVQCTRSKYGRRIKRWIHEEVIERLEKRLAENPEMLRMRKSIVEHPFGTMKTAMGHRELLMKGLKNVGTEINLTVLSYNIKRAISVLGAAVVIDRLKMQAA